MTSPCLRVMSSTDRCSCGIDLVVDDDRRRTAFERNSQHDFRRLIQQHARAGWIDRDCRKSTRLRVRAIIDCGRNSANQFEFRHSSMHFDHFRRKRC